MTVLKQKHVGEFKFLESSNIDTPLAFSVFCDYCGRTEYSNMYIHRTRKDFIHSLSKNNWMQVLEPGKTEFLVACGDCVHEIE
jgi:hypothetical protein